MIQPLLLVFIISQEDTIETLSISNISLSLVLKRLDSFFQVIL